MEIDLTAVTDEVAEKIWDARLMLTGHDPYKELSLDVQNRFKEQILPIIFYTVPIVEKAIKDKIDREIDWTSNSDSWNECQNQLESIREDIKIL